MADHASRAITLKVKIHFTDEEVLRLRAELLEINSIDQVEVDCEKGTFCIIGTIRPELLMQYLQNMDIMSELYLYEVHEDYESETSDTQSHQSSSFQASSRSSAQNNNGGRASFQESSRSSAQNSNGGRSSFQGSPRSSAQNSNGGRGGISGEERERGARAEAEANWQRERAAREEHERREKKRRAKKAKEEKHVCEPYDPVKIDPLFCKDPYCKEHKSRATFHSKVPSRHCEDHPRHNMHGHSYDHGLHDLSFDGNHPFFFVGGGGGPSRFGQQPMFGGHSPMMMPPPPYGFPPTPAMNHMPQGPGFDNYGYYGNPGATFRGPGPFMGPPYM